jgi:TrmH family RNA methyltransferase
MTDTLLSDKNPLLKEVRRAAARGSLTSDGFAVAEGFHLLEEALRSRCEIRLVIAADTVKTTVATHVGGLKQTRVVAVSETAFAALASTETPQGVLALVRPPAWTLAQLVRGRPLVVVLDGVQDPGNAGAIVRAAEAFGATGVAFLKGSVNPYNPKCLRASAGSTFRLPVVAALEESLLIAALEQKRATLYAALPRSENQVSRLISEADLTRNCALVIGSEGRGVSARLQRESTGLRIPTSGVESLNAAVAAGILLYEARRQRALQGDES